MAPARNRRFVIAAVIMIIVLVLWAIISTVQHAGKTKVKIVALPHDSSLSLDGQAIKEGSIYLKPGSHKFTATRQFFGDLTKTVNTKDLAAGQVLYLMPLANSAQALQWLTDHPETQTEREAAGGVESEQIQTALLKKYPVLAKLPQENLHYKIDYSIDSSQTLKLHITTYGIINGPADYPTYVQQTKSYRQEALDFLSQNGLKSSDVAIDYTPNP
jgi:hypothetical protein